MAFENTHIPNVDNFYGDLKGRLIPIAVISMCDANGNFSPLRFKYQNDKGELISITDLFVYKSEIRNYSGIKSQYFHCKITDYGTRKEVKIMFIMDQCVWRLHVEEK